MHLYKYVPQIQDKKFYVMYGSDDGEGKIADALYR